MRTNQRGSALIAAVVVILVITVIGVGMVSFAGRELAGASSAKHEQALKACAEAARLALQSQFHSVGFDPKSLTALNMRLGTTSTSSGAQTWAMGGHYDTNSTNVVIDQVTPLPPTSIGPAKNVRDLSNVSSTVGGGGTPFKVSTHCQDGATGRQLEVEFGIEFGL